MKKYIFSLVLILTLIIQPAIKAAHFADLSNFAWATEAIERLAIGGVMNGTGNQNFGPGSQTTRGEYITTMMRMLGENAEVDDKSLNENFPDVQSDRFYYQYIAQAKALGFVSGRDDGLFYPEEHITRQDMFVMAARIIGASSPSDTRFNTLNFQDAEEIADYARPYIEQMSQFIMGDNDNCLNPQNTATRAEMAVFVDRVRESQFPPTPSTYIIGESTVSLEQAQLWAAWRGASQKFVDAADYYWYYGELTGIRADVLYAQAAKETAFGRFGNRVTEEMNNWAGIKIENPSGEDLREDHEIFETSRDGVRAHFNHMAAYVGLEPIGEPHARYHVVMSLSWAGTIRFAEELGGRWAPSESYGNDLVANFLTPMQNHGSYVVDKSLKVVYLSPSDQFANRFAVGSTNEGEQMQIIAALVKQELERRGFTVYVRNPGTTFQQAADDSAAAGAFAYVAIHSNAANGIAVGTETFYRENDGESISLAGIVQRRVEALSPSSGRGLKNGTSREFAEIRLPLMATCLLEVEFHDVVETAEWIIANRPQIARAIADGIEEYWRE